MLDVTSLLEEIKASPFEEQEIVAPHTGVVTFGSLKLGDKVIARTAHGRNGPERSSPPSRANATQSRSTRSRRAKSAPSIANWKGHTCRRAPRSPPIRHFLSKDEVLRILLKQALNLFVAPERAKYYFVPQIDTKIKVSGCRSVSVYEGMELFIVSRMKREMPLYYTGPDGLIYTVYFEHNENVDAGSPLIGVCPPDQLQQIEEVVLKVQTEWQEQE